MKKILTLFFVSCAIMIANAQVTVPNAGFEQWNNGAASSWSTSFSYAGTLASFDYESGERTGDCHTGSYAMKLHPAQVDLTMMTYSLPGLCHLGFFNTELGLTSLLGIFNGGIGGIIDAMVEGGITCNQVPTKATAWVKYIPAGEDEMTVTVRCYRDGEVVAEGKYTSNSASGVYQQIEIPVVASGTDAPDQLNVIFSCGSNEGTYLYVDDVALEFGAPGVGISEPCNAIFSMNPNPATDMLNITSTMDGRFSASLFDTNGKLVWEETGLQGDTQVNVSDFTPGVYFLRVNNNGLSRTQKVIIR